MNRILQVGGSAISKSDRGALSNAAKVVRRIYGRSGGSGKGDRFCRELLEALLEFVPIQQFAAARDKAAQLPPTAL